MLHTYIDYVVYDVYTNNALLFLILLILSNIGAIQYQNTLLSLLRSMKQP